MRLFVHERHFYPVHGQINACFWGRKAGAMIAGAGIAIEKVFQGGGNLLRAEGMRIESLAKITTMSDNGLEFEK